MSLCRWCVFVAGLSVAFSATARAEDARRWEIAKRAEGWRLLKDGQEFYVKGAVGWNRFDVLKASGGNAVRTNASKASLDAAHQAGLAVMANLPVRGERNGIDWNNAEQVAAQQRKVLEVVASLKEHPALLFWAVGNELDHIPGRDSYDPQLWQRLNDLAVAIKKIDQRHPVLTVVGTGHFEQKVQQIAAACKDMDLLGINAYGDLAAVTEQARKHWPKPYVVAEWGPTGHWQVPKTKWRAPLEQTSSEKARVTDERYKSVILADRTNCLGSFVFYWSEKQETTHTWYGLFLDGLRTESIDVMQRHWTGRWPENRAPAIGSLSIVGFSEPRSIQLIAGQTYRAEIQANDPDGDALTFAWDIRAEVEIPKGSYAGSMEKKARPVEGLIREPAQRQIEFTAPAAGPYRLFVAVKDGKGSIGYGNVPFLVVEQGR